MSKAAGFSWVLNEIPAELTLCEQLFMQQFQNLMNQSDYKAAAKLAAESPQQVSGKG